MASFTEHEIHFMKIALVRVMHNVILMYFYY